MRFSSSDIANIIGWGFLLVLAALAIKLVAALGPVGLILLGLGTLLVCTLFNLSEETPTWGVEVFRSRQRGHSSPEERAAMEAERRARRSPLRYYRWCGIVLLVAGVAGITWQLWS